MKLIIIHDIPQMNLQEGDRGEFEPATARKLVNSGYAIYDGYEPQSEAQPMPESPVKSDERQKEIDTKTKTKK